MPSVFLKAFLVLKHCIIIPSSMYLKNSISHKPDSVIPTKVETAIIYLAVTLLLQSCCLPSSPAKFSFSTRTSRPQRLVYVALQHTRFTRKICYQILPWALTSRFHPHPCPKAETVIFCGTFSFQLPESRLLTGVLPFAVRTFLSSLRKNDSRLIEKQK